MKKYSSSSSVGPTAYCGLWPVKQYFSIFPYLSPTLSPSSHSQHLKILLTSSVHPFLGLPLRLVSSSSWVKIILGILSSSSLSRWPSQLILCPFIHFTIFPPLLNSSSTRIVLLFHSPSSYLGPHILLNSFLSKISRACFSFFVVVHEKILGCPKRQLNLKGVSDICHPARFTFSLLNLHHDHVTAHLFHGLAVYLS